MCSSSGKTMYAIRTCVIAAALYFGDKEDGDAVEIAREWVNKQLPIPEPDWDAAPDWAMNHTAECTGHGAWYDLEPVVGNTMWVPQGQRYEQYEEGK